MRAHFFDSAVTIDITKGRIFELLKMRDPQAFSLALIIECIELREGQTLGKVLSSPICVRQIATLMGLAPEQISILIDRLIIEGVVENIKGTKTDIV